MTERSTKEQQYQATVETDDRSGRTKLGLMINYAWDDDPKRLSFTFARYKFVAKMLDGRNRVLEVGCGDGFVSRVVAQHVGALTAVDFDPVFVADANALMSDKWRFEAKVHDILKGPVEAGSGGGFDAAYSMDVLEHIEATDEDRYLANIAASLTDQGCVIIGMPSLESQPYASKLSKEGHVNCKTAPDLKASVGRHFGNVFMFSMNDEVVHTGYHKMAQYIIALGVGPLR